MAAAASSRIRLAAVVVIASALGFVLIVSASPTGADAGSASLEPDLVTLPLGEQDLAMQLDGSRTLLRFSNEIGNLGAGPLEIAPSAASNDCDGDADPANDRDASQRVYEDADGSGGFEAGSDPLASEHRFGCMRYHLTHDHWHVLDIARYALRHEPSGKLAARTRKVGFCLADFSRAFPSPSSPLEPVYPIEPADGTAQRGCQASDTQGLSSGWADIYLLDVPGQQLEVSRLERGRYCLISTTDPRDLISERDESNNSTSLRIALRPKAPSVRALARPCSA